jgi:hypothetical protein
MTLSANMTRGEQRQATSRDDIITALRRYAELYGPDFAAWAFSPSTAKWADREYAIERYYAGDPETGKAWPSLNAIKAAFGGFSAARVAAGLPANRPGPAKRRAKGEHRPIRGVSHAGATRTLIREVDGGESRRRAERAEAKAERLSRKVEKLEAKLAERPRATAPAKPITQTKTKTKTVRVRDERALERERERAVKAQAKLEAKIAEAREAEKLARVDLAEARQAATRAASKLERAEATIHELRADKRELRTAAEKAEDRAVAAERERDVLRERKPERIVVREESPEAAAVRLAETTAERAERDAHAAELRAARAEREYMELAAAVKGEARKLTAAEISELRARGPAGPVLVKNAIAAYIKAGRNPTALRAALTKMASAAITYRERL